MVIVVILCQRGPFLNNGTRLHDCKKDLLQSRHHMMLNGSIPGQARRCYRANESQWRIAVRDCKVSDRGTPAWRRKGDVV